MAFPPHLTVTVPSPPTTRFRLPPPPPRAHSASACVLLASAIFTIRRMACASGLKTSGGVWIVASGLRHGGDAAHTSCLGVDACARFGADSTGDQFLQWSLSSTCLFHWLEDPLGLPEAPGVFGLMAAGPAWGQGRGRDSRQEARAGVLMRTLPKEHILRARSWQFVAWLLVSLPPQVAGVSAIYLTSGEMPHRCV